MYAKNAEGRLSMLRVIGLALALILAAIIVTRWSNGKDNY